MIEQTSVSSHSSMGSPSRMALSRAQCSHHCEKKAMPSVPLLGRYFSATTHLPELVVDANRCPRLKQRALVEGHGLLLLSHRPAIGSVRLWRISAATWRRPVLEAPSLTASARFAWQMS